MPFQPVPNATEVAMRYIQDGQTVTNIWAVSTASAPTPELLAEIGAVFDSWNSASLTTLQSNTVTLTEIELRYLGDATGPTLLYTPTGTQTGSDVSPALPNHNTITVKLGTASAGRSFRGRKYHIGLVESMVTANRVNPVTLSNLLEVYQELRQLLETTTAKLGVVSRVANGAPRTNGIITVVTGMSIDPVVDSQRRRLPGRGS